MKNLKEFTDEFNEIKAAKIFEIPVIRKDNGEKDYIIFDIAIDDEFMVANHEPLTHEQVESNKIPFEKVEIDLCFGISCHLEDLYSECINAILESDFFELINEED